MGRPRTDADPDTPKVLDKALRVLEAFGETRERWTEADLRRHLGMPSSSLNRILRGLERAGYDGPLPDNCRHKPTTTGTWRRCRCGRAIL